MGSAKMKSNNLRQGVNRKIYTSMGNELRRMRPGVFLHRTFSLPINGDRKINLENYITSSDSLEGCGAPNPLISSAIDATGSVTTLSEGQHLSPYVDSSTEVSGSSQSSLSSQDTSFHSPIGSYHAPVASMINNPGYLGMSSHESNEPAMKSHLPPAPRLKRSYSVAGMGTMNRGKRLNGKYDPENQEIMRLRQEEDLDFQAIADRLNAERKKNGVRDDLTDNAVYSRYTRNAPLIAQMRNEKFVPTIKDNKFTKMKFQKVQPISGFDPEEDTLLELATWQVQEQFWALVSERIQELGGGFHDPDTCERRFDCL